VHVKTGEKYALKTLQKKNMPADAKEKYHREISMMAQLDHPNILRLHEYFENDSFIYLILDLCTGGKLRVI
jgi:serine/threonine protein kinase